MTPLEQKQQSLADKAVRRNLRQQLAESVTTAELDALTEGLKKMPVTKIIEHAQYLDNVILPGIEKKHGLTSDQFKQFKGVFDALIWSLHVQNLFDRYQYQLSNQNLLCEFYREKCIWYERELMRYTTRENLLMEESFMDLKQIMSNNGVNNLKYKYATMPDPTPTESSTNDLLM